MTKMKGVYDLNPTKQVMKQGSAVSRYETTRHPEDYPGPSGSEEPREVPADEGNETAVFPHSHPAMQTRHSHPANLKHADGRRHEDQHHAVKQLKGKY
jgi:hypothetical protein